METLNGEQIDDDEELPASSVTWFRGLAARANYLSLDRCDIQFGGKEVCRCMAKPTKGGLRKLKALVRYLVEVPELMMKFGAEDKKDRWLESMWIQIGQDVRRQSDQPAVA